MKRFLCTSSLALLLYVSLSGQNMLRNAQNFLKENLPELELTLDDVSNLKVSDQYTSSTSDITNIYFQQSHEGIGLYNGILNIHLNSSGKVITYGNRFVPNLKDKTNSATPTLTAQKAIESAANQLGYRFKKVLEVLEFPTGTEQRMLFDKSDLSQENIPVKLVWQLMPDKKVYLAWDMSILALDGQDWWSVRIDARTGELLDKTNWMLHCDWDSPHHHTQHKHTTHPTDHQSVNIPAAEWTPFMAGSYRAYPIGVESPIHGDIDFIVDPHTTNASPFGWHDTDGATGAEFTITRGNNVYAQEDQDANNTTFGDAPDGGASLVFDFPPDFQEEPTTSENIDAALTNLFYWNNIIHDVLYEFGFTEECGNFQENNYGKGGLGSDSVIADGLDGGGTNNANFGTPDDGGNPRMQMFLWNSVPPTFTVNAPEELAGTYVAAGASFGPSPFNISGDLIIVDDGNDQGGTGTTTDACQTIINDLTGKIALIDRGLCNFSCKVENAQNQGAIAAIICNNEPGLLTMGAGACGGNVNIPSLMVSLNDCNTIRTQIPTVNVTLTSPAVSSLDGDFDNGIIAHEYGHGVSNRLTGGPGTAGCLAGSEQMGEGWSDFIGLYLTTDSDNTGPEGRGIGNYATGRPADGGGIRPFPYSTDMGVNPHTYGDVGSVAIPHGVGSIWCAMLWEVYWVLADEHGFNNDYYAQTGGNNMAFQLVMEGMKLQPCNPGFVDGRDAILAADRALYGGMNQCLIWEAFAKRGLGFSANQGSLNSTTDGTEAFDMPPSCKLLFNITVDKTNALLDTELEYTLTATNPSTDVLNNIQLSSKVPENTTYIDGGTLNGDMVSFVSFNLNPAETQTRTFRVRINDALSLMPFDFTDDVENSGENWTAEATYAALNNWAVTTDNPNTGASSWFAQDVNQPNTQHLTLAIEQRLTNLSTLNFSHSYNTEATWDGGTVKISTDNGVTWTDLGPHFTNNGYDNNINQSPNAPAFGGNSNGYIESSVDLSSFADEFALVRFTMHCDAATGGVGWYIDDISLTELLPSIPNQATADCDGQIINTMLDNPTLVVATLPLELTAFTGKVLDNGNLIQWTTAQEIDLSTFQVERSVDGRNDWKIIGEQIPRGQHNGSYSYQLEDKQPLPTAFYRLRTIENTGKELLSTFIFLQRKEAVIKDFNVFPNPVHQQLSIEFSATETQSLDVVVHNVLGQEQVRKTISAQVGLNRQQLDMQALQSGVYWMVLRDGANIVWEGKIVVD